MFKTILVPLDGTTEAATIVPVARAFARAGYAELVLVRVTADYHDDAPANVAARQYLADVVREYGLGDLRVRTQLRYGDIAEQVLEAATQEHADLIALATHGRHGLARAWFGSVAERVLAESTVPVLLLRADGRSSVRLGTLLVPLDSSPGSAVALAAARDVATLTDARLVLLEVVVPLPRWGEGWDISPGWEEEVRVGAQGFVTQVAKGLRAHGIAADGTAAIGPVAEMIGRVARERAADLIVMSTHALTGPRRAVLGSVADAVVRTAGLPVLLVRRGETAAPVAAERDMASATPTA